MKEISLDPRPRWRAPSIEGDRVVFFDGVVHRVPADADLKLVGASGGRQFLHVRTEGRVVVLSREGELDEPTHVQRRHARKDDWHSIPGDII